MGILNEETKRALDVWTIQNSCTWKIAMEDLRLSEDSCTFQFEKNGIKVTWPILYEKIDDPEEFKKELEYIADVMKLKSAEGENYVEVSVYLKDAMKWRVFDAYHMTSTILGNDSFLAISVTDGTVVYLKTSDILEIKTENKRF